MEKIKKTNKLLYIIFTAVFVVLLTVSLIIPKNKTFASENIGKVDFIQQYEYTISVGNLSEIVVYSNGTYWEYSIDNCYLSFSNGDCYFSYPTLYNGSNYDADRYTYNTVKLDKLTNSQRTRYYYNSFMNTPLIISAIRYVSDNGQTIKIAGDLQVTYIELNIPITTTIQDVFYNAFNTRELLYRRNVNTGYGTESLLTTNKIYYDFDVDSPLMSTYISTTNLSGDTTVVIPNNYIYQNNIVKFDRSEYIKTEIKEVYVDPFVDPIVSIVNGVGNFFNIEIFPNFRLGSIFIILLGVSFFGFLLHLLVK